MSRGYDSISASLSKINKLLKGEEKAPMTPTPSYPKGFKTGGLVSLSSKPKIVQAFSTCSVNILLLT